MNLQILCVKSQWPKFFFLFSSDPNVCVALLKNKILWGSEGNILQDFFTQHIRVFLGSRPITHTLYQSSVTSGFACPLFVGFPFKGIPRRYVCSYSLFTFSCHCLRRPRNIGLWKMEKKVIVINAWEGNEDGEDEEQHVRVKIKLPAECRRHGWSAVWWCGSILSLEMLYIMNIHLGVYKIYGVFMSCIQLSGCLGFCFCFFNGRSRFEICSSNGASTSVKIVLKDTASCFIRKEIRILHKGMWPNGLEVLVRRGVVHFCIPYNWRFWRYGKQERYHDSGWDIKFHINEKKEKIVNL